MLENMKLYGATTVGERGQIVLPADLRKTRGIKPGDKFLVMGKVGGSGAIVLIDAESVTRILESAGEMIEKISKEATKSGVKNANRE